MTCQRPLPDSVVTAGAAQCAPCLAAPPCHDGIGAGTIYNDTSRALVLSLKYGKRIALAPMMARLINARLQQFSGSKLFVPVPLHRWRLWHRGFNQAALLAQQLAHMRGDALIPDALIRKKRTPPLEGLGRKARLQVMNGAIAVNKRCYPDVAGADIVLVDDVLTSGATSFACVRTLKKAGARTVIIACFARVSDTA